MFNLAILISFLTIMILLVRTAFIGDKYDIEKRKIDSKYKGSHFWGFKHSIAIPFKIVDNTDNQKIQTIIDSYNKSSSYFWRVVIISLIVILLIYCYNN